MGDSPGRCRWRADFEDEIGEEAPSVTVLNLDRALRLPAESVSFPGL